MPAERPRTGELTKRVSIERVTRTRDSVGGWTETWPTAGDPLIPRVWANIEPIGGNEPTIGEQVTGRASYLITLHYRSDLTTKDRIRFGTRIFNIVRIDDVGGLNERLELTCIEAV